MWLYYFLKCSRNHTQCTTPRSVRSIERNRLTRSKNIQPLMSAASSVNCLISHKMAIHTAPIPPLKKIFHRDTAITEEEIDCGILKTSPTRQAAPVQAPRPGEPNLGESRALLFQPPPPCLPCRREKIVPARLRCFAGNPQNLSRRRGDAEKGAPRRLRKTES